MNENYVIRRLFLIHLQTTSCLKPRSIFNPFLMRPNSNKKMQVLNKKSYLVRIISEINYFTAKSLN